MTSSTCPYPFNRNSPFEPAAEFTRLRLEEPVTQVILPSGEPGWVVSRYQDVATVLEDSRFGRADLMKPDAPTYSGVQPPPVVAASMAAMDPPEHSRVRSMVNREFTARRVELMRPVIQRYADQIVADMASRTPPADLSEQLSFDLPVKVISELLGVPPVDRDKFGRWSRTAAQLDRDPGEILAAAQALYEYMNGLVADKRKNLGADLLSALIAQHGEDHMTDVELVIMGLTMLLTGYATTSVVLTSCLATLLAIPARWEELQKNPSLVADAAEEALRLNPPGNGGMMRITRQEVELGGVVIPRGVIVMAALDSANRDPARFPAPDSYDPRRSENAHLSFGRGIHYCLGAALARAEIQIAVETLLRRLPTLRLAVRPEDLEFNAHSLEGGVRSLPVTW
ncbi:MAG: cytochrome P450 [Streptosporangiaceae bacterium]|nr:cytochrome P450 [Streptosporangiaceae bacterium]MBV9854018.1 cytochrome P450 [Streptosporangiaceae bacterium]